MKDQEFQLDERTLMVGKKVRPSGTMNMRGSEGAARRDVSRAGFRKKGPIQDPKVEKSGKDVPVWVRTHKSPGDYAAHTARKQHREGDKPQSKELKKQFGKTGAKKDSPVHDITVGSPKSKVKDPGQRARQFVGALKGVKDTMKSKKGVATNTPTAISSSGKKRKRSDEEGAEQRGRVYKKLGMGERNQKTGVQMAKLSDSFYGKTFGDFMSECYIVLEVNRPESGSDVEKARWDAVKNRHDAMSPEEKASRIIGTLGRDKNGIQRYGFKNKDSRKNQQTNRASRLADVDSDLDTNQKQRGDKKANMIKGRGKEHHHLTPISQSAKEFKGLTPEQRRAKREKDAKGGKFHGSDPRNIAQTDGPGGGKGIPHRGEGGYHSTQKPVGKGGSIQDFGSEKDIVAARRRVERQGSASEKLAKEKGIITPRARRRISLNARIANSPYSQEQRRRAQLANNILRDIRNR
jgi:hypothetical protein